MSDTETRDIVIRLPREHIRRATVSLHLRSPEYDDDLVRYVVHDPERYTADPLGNDKRVRELHEMLSAILNATDMTPAEKATEVARLSVRIVELLEVGGVRDDVATISEATGLASLGGVLTISEEQPQ
jgi:hypothetical protein